MKVLSFLKVLSEELFHQLYLSGKILGSQLRLLERLFNLVQKQLEVQGLGFRM